jgi:hypothetical protein
MEGQLFELMFYPHFAALLLWTFAFLSAEVTSELAASRGVLDSSAEAVDASNLALLNCTPDHFLGACNLTQGEGWPVRRLVTDGASVKGLISPVPD